ncbi:hypothetical protein FHR81_001534 [Actinoalloteichus hoggarensis]|uniref:Uncharacterized protein n=1 Tax=Actinoalloteichus hoggarensis TaxID=1470176 RepID=A0A221W0E7_9PSEU|nr:hypothetical protein [Actinoalloteichus hoggarensis]ASO19266.1 hypothetical protein AHOG_08105 [Actinoalloteichus hoggarensis]MBB5920504.1 hypothetical protein [Actinoalloteichus hoggarensis]
MPLLAAGLLASAAPAWAAVAVPEPEPVCVMTDPAVTMLSGLVSDGDRWYMVNDHDPLVQVFVVGRDCVVERVIPTGVDHYDVGDLAMAPDGTLWVAETGDNRLRRETVALVSVRPDGVAALHRLTYPDGPRDAEALLIGRDGVPYIVTKQLIGPAEIYRPAEPLAVPGPVPLERVGEVRLSGSDTPGGPVPGFVGSFLVTGGSVHPDGTMVALRTYTDAYLFSAPDGDVLSALAGEPLRIPLPNEPQGEAVAWEPDGTLLSGSEGADQPIRAVPDAAGLLVAELERRDREAAASTDPEPERGESVHGAARSGEASANSDAVSSPRWQELGLSVSAVLIAAATLAWWRGRGRRARR